MGYFNYFVKCIIRNIAYRLCRPKVLLSFLFIILLTFIFCNYCFGASAEGQVQLVNPNNDFVNEYGDTVATIQYDNQFLSVKTIEEEIQREFILKLYSMYSSTPDSAKLIARDILEKIRSISLDSNGGGDNMGIYIQRAGAASQYRVNFYKHKSLSDAVGYGAYVNYNLYFLNVPYQTGIVERYNLDNNTHWVLTTAELKLQIPVPMIGVFVPEWITLFRDFGLINSVEQNTLGAIEEQNNLINEQNRLQEEQNEQQKEQNDFLKEEATDDDVSVDSFNSVDSNDITSDGLTGVFNNIYNSITSWSSKDINLPIPYTNKSIKIPANYTENMLNSSGAGWIVTFVHSIYYFIVARFIIYSITSIINSIKSGSILETDSRNNITTDML